MGFYSTNLAAYFPNILIRSFEPIANNYNQIFGSGIVVPDVKVDTKTLLKG